MRRLVVHTLAMVVVVGAWVHPTCGQTARDLTAEAESLVLADERSAVSLEKAVALYTRAAQLEPDKAAIHLVAAVEADQSFPKARLDLADLYRGTGRPAVARAQAQAVLEMAPPLRGRLWRERYRPAAEAILRRLAAE